MIFPSLSSTAALTQMQVLFFFPLLSLLPFRYAHIQTYCTYVEAFCIFTVLAASLFFVGVFVVLFYLLFVLFFACYLVCLFIDFLVLCSSPACCFANAAENAINCSFISNTHRY